MAERRCYRGCRDHLYHTPMGDGWYEVSSVSDGMWGQVEVENCDPTSENYSSCAAFSWSVMGKCDSQDAARAAAAAWIADGAVDA